MKKGRKYRVKLWAYGQVAVLEAEASGAAAAVRKAKEQFRKQNGMDAVELQAEAQELKG